MEGCFWASRFMQYKTELRNSFQKNKLYHDGGPYHIETNPLICRSNQWTGFRMIGTSAI